MKSKKENTLAELSESIQQQMFLSWFKESYPGELIFSIPNQGQRSLQNALRMKREGLTPGIPDLFVPGKLLWIEIKKEKGKLRPQQKDICSQLNNLGYHIIIGYGLEDLIIKVRDFMEEFI
jgi:hypothetical protein